MCKDGEFLVHTNILKKINKLFENFDNVYNLICHLHTLSYNEIHIEHVVFHFGCMVIIAMITICLPIVVKLSPGCTLSGKPWRTIMYANDYHLSTICLQNVYILENHSDCNGVQSENRDVHDCTTMITVCLPIVVNCLQKAYILENHSDRDGVQSENRGVHDCTSWSSICHNSYISHMHAVRV